MELVFSESNCANHHMSDYKRGFRMNYIYFSNH
jgi:hypothetical protein